MPVLKAKYNGEWITVGTGGGPSGSGGGVDVQNAVLYIEQTLNADQRAQARENIGVEEEIAESLLALEIVKTFGDEDGAIAEDGTVLVARNDELFLPPVNEENEGNVLTVVDGKWAVEPVEFAGGDGGAVDLEDLTFTGAVNAVYDGSHAVSIEIPEAPVKSVNGQTGEVNLEIPSVDGLASEKYVDDAIAAIPKVEAPVTSVNGMTGDVVINVPSVDGLATEEYVNEAIGAIEVPVTSVNGMTGDVIIEIPESFSGSWNDLTDKPFYEEGSGTTIEWDGSTEGRDSFDFEGTFYKVSDVAPTADEVIGGSISYLNGAEIDGYSLNADAVIPGDGCVMLGEMVIVVLSTESSIMDIPITAPSTGVYFLNTSVGDTIVRVKSLTYGSSTIKTLDEKFIPDSIARVENVVTSVNGMTGDVTIAGGTGGNGSWNDLTEKPFYDIEPICEPIYENVTVSLTSSTDEQEVACLTGTLVEVEPNLTIAAGEKYKLQVNGTEYFGTAKNLPPIYPIPEHDEKKTGFIVDFHDNNNNNLVYTVSLLKPEYYYYNSTIESIWLEQDVNYNSIIFTSYDLNLGETALISLHKVIADAQQINPKYVYRSDWNENDGTKPEYVKNRPFYKDQYITEELIFDGKYVFDELGEGHYLPSPFDNFKDESYIVEWDGVRYDCKARYHRDQDDNTIDLGWETKDDSSIEPFSLLAGNSKDNGIMWAYLKEVTTPQEVHRCKIYRKSQNWLCDQDFIYAMQLDWDEDDKNSKNYIKNKICSRKATDYTYLIDEKEPIYINSSSGDNVLYTTTVQVSSYPIENKTYSITIGSNSVKDLPYTGNGYIGNRYLYDRDSRHNTGEPVLVVFSKDGTAMIFTTYSEVGRTRVYGSAYKYNPIDDLYLPSYFPRAKQANVGDVVVVAATGTTASTYKVPTRWRATNIESLIPPTDWDTVQNKPFGEIAEKLDEIFNQDLNFVNYTAGLYVAELTNETIVNSINPGSTYVVNWDGEDYTCIESMAEESGDQMVLGNMGIAMGQSGTGEPFCIMIMPGQAALVATTSSDSQHHLEIYNGSLSVLHLDEKYIPDSVAKASTAQVGQTIVVKSIDENGKPTEWECVDMPTWIPNFTESDEGAILKIVNGVPTWVSESNG